MTPKNKMATAFRNEVLDLAKTFNFARRLINSGRLSTPYVLPHSPLKNVDYKENRFFYLFDGGEPRVRVFDNALFLFLLSIDWL